MHLLPETSNHGAVVQLGRIRRYFCIVLLGLAAAAGCSRKTPAPEAQGARGAAPCASPLADDYFDQVYFHYAPSNGTLRGLHQYDAQLEDYSRAAVDRETADQERFESKFAAIPVDQLDLTSQGDLELLLGNIHSTLLSLNTIRLWEKDPDQYSSGISNGAFVLMERTFASPDDRLRSLVAREKLMPAALEAAHQNLKNPPRIYTEIALEQLPDIISFFQSDVPAAFKEARNEQLKSEFSQSNGAVIAALKDYQTGSGRTFFPAPMATSNLARRPTRRSCSMTRWWTRHYPGCSRSAMPTCTGTRRSSSASRAKSTPTGQPREVLAELAHDHPAPDHLLQSFRDTFQGLIQFIQEKHIVDIPSPVRPTLEDTPPFMRATTTASMDTPGPFEKVATEAYFNVTVPGAPDSPQRNRTAHGGVQSGDHHQYGDPRGLSGALRAVSVGAAGAEQSAQAFGSRPPMPKAGPTIASR